MAEGNRKDPRARVLNMTVRYKSATVDEFIENHSHDISRGGIFIKTRAPFPAGTLLKFEVRIAEDQRLMQGVGRVVWRREPERAEEGFPAGMGIKFIKTGEGAAELISQIVAAREGEESSFDAGNRENGADSGNRRSLPPAEVAAAELPGAALAAEPSEPPRDAPALHVEPAPLSGVPVEGEIRVSSPPKKRPPPVPERKVVLQGAAADTPASDKTPISTREVSAQAAPNRAASSARERSSLVDETTAPRARAVSVPAARPEADKQTSPSVYGLVAILGVIALGVLFVKLVRSPDEPAPVPPPVVTTAPVPPPPPPVPVVPAPQAAAPAEEPGEGTPVPEPSAGTEPAAPSAAEQPAVAAPTPGAGAAPAAAAPGIAAPSAAPSPAAAPSAAPKPVAPPTAGAANVAPAVPAPKPAPTGAAPAPAAPAPVPAPPAAAKPPAPAAKPPVEPAPAAKPVVKPPAPAPAEPPSASVRPAAPEAAPAAPPGTAGAPAATGEAKKRPPAAAAPAEPEPAPKPAAPAAPKPAAPSDDNPY